ncbi:hypothetical protein Tco_1385680 [Tanacetum coccineum]
MSSSTVTYTSISSDSDLPPWGFHLISDAEPHPEYPKYLAQSDNEILGEDQPLRADASPTALSPGYVADSDPLEEDPEEDPANEGDDDDEEEESFKDDEEQEASKDEDEDEEEEEIKPFETDESTTTPPPPRSPQTIVPSSMTRLLKSCITIYLPSITITITITTYIIFISTPQISSPQLPVPCPLLPVPSPPLLLLYIDRRSDIPKSDMPSRKRLCLTSPASRLMTSVEEVNERVTDLAATQRQDTHELFVRHEDTQDDRALLRAQISLLTRERRYFRSMSLSYEYRELERTRDAECQDGPADAGSSC